MALEAVIDMTRKGITFLAVSITRKMIGKASSNNFVDPLFKMWAYVSLQESNLKLNLTQQLSTVHKSFEFAIAFSSFLFFSCCFF